MEKNRNKLRLFIFTMVILASIVASGISLYKIEQNKKPIVADKIRSGDLNYLYNFYLSSSPNSNYRPYYGSESASITLIAFLNIESEASGYFIEEIFPMIRDEYINTGEVKYYHKNYITVDDINARNSNFIYAATLSCVNELKKEDYYNVYLDLFSISGLEEIEKLLERYNISFEDYDGCMSQGKFDELYEDASEIENFGMVGVNQRFYIGIGGRDNTILDGVPKFEKFNRTIRQYETQIGN